MKRIVRFGWAQYFSVECCAERVGGDDSIGRAAAGFAGASGDQVAR
jgi:hypothetical protein